MAEEKAEAGKGNTNTDAAAGTLTGDEGKNTATADGAGAKKDDAAVAGKAAEGDAGKGGKAGEKADEQKKADDKAGDGGKKGSEGKGGKEGEQPKAPDKYELEMPSDAGDYLDESDLKTVEGVARAKGWTNEQAQASLDEYADGLAKQSAGFRAETEKDPTYGGDNLAETQRLARLALDKVRPANTEEGKGLRRLLAKSGYGNNLRIVSFLADLGKLMAEDSPGGSSSGGKGGSKDAATLLYGESAAGE